MSEECLLQDLFEQYLIFLRFFCAFPKGWGVVDPSVVSTPQIYSMLFLVCLIVFFFKFPYAFDCFKRLMGRLHGGRLVRAVLLRKYERTYLFGWSSFVGSVSKDPLQSAFDRGLAFFGAKRRHHHHHHHPRFKRSCSPTFRSIYTGNRERDSRRLHFRTYGRIPQKPRTKWQKSEGRPRPESTQTERWKRYCVYSRRHGYGVCGWWTDEFCLQQVAILQIQEARLVWFLPWSSSGPYFVCGDRSACGIRRSDVVSAPETGAPGRGKPENLPYSPTITDQ